VNSLSLRDLSDSARPERVNAVATLGFTERQARFLVRVLVHAGVFLERQYCTFSDITHGQKSHDFLAKLVGRGYATVITPGALHRGRLFHVQYKPLYEAIGEPNNRHRKPASLGRLIERLMLLDAVLADPRYTWLATEQDKLNYFIFGLLKSRLRDVLNRWTSGATCGRSVPCSTRCSPGGAALGLLRAHVDGRTE
jgi:hypothetical protein